MLADHLHRFAEPFPEHGGTQNIVTGDQLIKADHKGFQPLAAIEAQ